MKEYFSIFSEFPPKLSLNQQGDSMKRKKVKEPTLDELRHELGTLMYNDLESTINPAFMNPKAIELNSKKMDAILSQIERKKKNNN